MKERIPMNAGKFQLRLAAWLAVLALALPGAVRAEDEDMDSEGGSESSALAAVDPRSVILVGYLPGMYIRGAGVNPYKLAKVTITNGIITDIAALANAAAAGRVTGPEGVPVIHLK